MAITAKAAPKSSGNVINLMDALKRSLASADTAAPAPAPKAKAKKPKKRVEGQREMLLPIAGKGGKNAAAAKEAAPRKADKPVRATARTKKVG